MTRFQTSFVLVAAAAAVVSLGAQAPKPKHVNRAIELLEAGQPIYYTGSHSGTEGHVRSRASRTRRRGPTTSATTWSTRRTT